MSLSHFDAFVANKAETIVSVATLALLSHRRGDLFGEALGAKCLLWVVLCVPERCTKLVLVGLETQSLSQVAVLVFQF